MSASLVQPIIPERREAGLSPGPLLAPTEDVFGKLLVKSESGTRIKSVLLSPVQPNSWSGPTEEEARGLFTFATRVKGLKEGSAIFRSLTEYLPIQEEIGEERHGSFTRFKLEGLVIAHVWNSYPDKPLTYARPLPSTEGSLELVIEFERSAAAKQFAARFYESLLTSSEFQRGTPLWLGHNDYDLTSNCGRRDWGYFTYYKWAQSLSFEETRALQIIGGPDWRDIQRYMRHEATIGSPVRISEWAGNIQRAIAKGRTEREIKIYRAAGAPLTSHWESLYTNQSHEVRSSDPGFLMATLDPEFAKWWNESKLNNRGIIVSLTVPAGTPSAFLDAEGILTDRGYLELVLGPNESVVLHSASLTESGGKCLDGFIERTNEDR